MSKPRLICPVIANDEDIGSLGVIYLRRFWSQKISVRMQVVPEAPTARDLVAEKVLLAGLKLGLRETLDFLMTVLPSFEEFETWVLEKNDGAIAPERKARLNHALRGHGSFALETV